MLFEKGKIYERNGKTSQEFTTVFDWPMGVKKMCLDVEEVDGKYRYIMGTWFCYIYFDDTFSDYFVESKQ